MTSGDLVVTSRVVIPAAELEWKATRSSGPGGQNVNKLSTKVELRFDLAHTAVLDAGARARLQRLAAGRLDADGKLLIISQSTRSQGQNLEQARERLAALVRQALTPPKPRKPTRPTRGSKERRLKAKRHTAETKRARRSGPED